MWNYEQSERTRNRLLVEKYPFLIPASAWDGEEIKNYDYSYTWLDSLPVGWNKAFGEKMCAEIAEALKKSGNIEEYRIIEIKEKWGGLRWYDAGGTDETYEIIEKYEKISEKTCVKCGAPATKESVGWISPWCDGCAEKMSDRMRFVDMSYEGDGV